MIVRKEQVVVEALEGFARIVLEADSIALLALRVMDQREPDRLARAIELAAAVLDRGASAAIATLPVDAAKPRS